MNSNINHTFSRSEIKLAAHLLEKEIIKNFGEVWKIKSDGEYKGKSWDCRSVIAFDGGIWRLVQSVRHLDATRAAGRIETHDVGTMLRFIVFYDPLKERSLIA